MIGADVRLARKLAAASGRHPGDGSLVPAAGASTQATRTVNVPRPATPPTMVSPDTTAATPSGVPV